MGYKKEDRDQVELLREEVRRSLENVRHTHFESLGKGLANKETGIKKYWSIMNSFLNKNKFPIIPPLPI